MYYYLYKHISFGFPKMAQHLDHIPRPCRMPQDRYPVAPCYGAWNLRAPWWFCVAYVRSRCEHCRRPCCNRHGRLIIQEPSMTYKPSSSHIKARQCLAQFMIIASSHITNMSSQMQPEAARASNQSESSQQT